MANKFHTVHVLQVYSAKNDIHTLVHLNMIIYGHKNVCVVGISAQKRGVPTIVTSGVLVSTLNIFVCHFVCQCKV